jgi:hypothetical protein
MASFSGALEQGDHNNATEADPDEIQLNAIAARIESQLTTTIDPEAIPDRESVSRLFIDVLQNCDQQDRFRRPGSSLDSSPRRIQKLSEETVGRLIRCLGDLHAEAGIDVIAEYLFLPRDLGSMDGPKTGDDAASWALFVIGDSALPTVRRKMISPDTEVRNAAWHIAVAILGPRSSNKLAEWIDEATSDEEKHRLFEATNFFRVVSQNSSRLTPEEYRKRRLRDGRDEIAHLKTIRDEWKQFMKVEGRTK